ncbi:MAG: PD40 domain-containing protein [Gemmatimonadaceae bacterium]|nr:PD40 domain-containing protein [Gemmatimonadaceae bacterium]
MVLVACRGGGDKDMPDVTALSPAGVRQLGPSYSPDGKRIAYWTPSSPGWQLWIANADLSSAQKLPVKGGTEPALWSPDGSRLAVTSAEGRIVVVPVAGGEAKRVTTGSGFENQTGWFADGERLAYVMTTGEGGGDYRGFASSLARGATQPLVPGEKRTNIGTPSPDGNHIGINVSDGPNRTIWVADSAGMNPRQLTKEGFEDQVISNRMSWSPDGKSILYESRRTGTADLWVVPVDSGSPRQLTSDVRNDYGGVWSPDSKWVAFLSDRGRQTDIWLVRASGGEQRRVTDSPDAESNLAWRPGTNEVTFVTTSQAAGIWSMDMASGAERRLTPDSIRPTWFNGSPDGKQIDYTIERGGGVQDLAVMPVAGGASRILVSGGGTVVTPWWSPSGKQIVYLSDRGGSQDVWIVDVSVGAPRQLTSWPGIENGVAWSGDGTKVYFQSDHDTKLGDAWAMATDGGEPTRITRNGTLGAGSLLSRAGVADFFVQTISPNGGRSAISRVRPDGRMTTVWDRTNAYLSAVSPSGDSIAALVEQPDGTLHMMILPAAGGKGRLILAPNDWVTFWSNDGKSLVYTTFVDGVGDIGIFNVVDGTTRRLTATSQSEAGGEITPDGKTVLMRRMTIVQRLFTANLSKLLDRSK